MSRRGLAYWLGYAFQEPRDFAYCMLRRITCRLLHWHNVTCRGRRDHIRRYQEGDYPKPGWTVDRHINARPEPVSRRKT